MSDAPPACSPAERCAWQCHAPRPAAPAPPGPARFLCLHPPRGTRTCGSAAPSCISKTARKRFPSSLCPPRRPPGTRTCGGAAFEPRQQNSNRNGFKPSPSSPSSSRHSYLRRRSTKLRQQARQKGRQPSGADSMRTPAGTPCRRHTGHAALCCGSADTLILGESMLLWFHCGQSD